MEWWQEEKGGARDRMELSEQEQENKSKENKNERWIHSTIQPSTDTFYSVCRLIVHNFGLAYNSINWRKPPIC